MNSIPLTILVAALGGAVGAGITAGAGWAQARRSIREKARLALWAYQRALAGFAISQLQDAGYDEEKAHLLGNDFKAARLAYARAYPWAGYISPDAREDLFRSVSIQVGYPPYNDPDSMATAGTEALDLATRLENELDRVFPLRFSDRVQSWFRRG